VSGSECFRLTWEKGPQTLADVTKTLALVTKIANTGQHPSAHAFFRSLLGKFDGYSQKALDQLAGILVEGGILGCQEGRKS